MSQHAIFISTNLVGKTVYPGRLWPWGIVACPEATVAALWIDEGGRPMLLLENKDGELKMLMAEMVSAKQTQ